MLARLTTWTCWMGIALGAGAAGASQEMGGLDLSNETAPAPAAPSQVGSLDLSGEGAGPPSAGGLDLTVDASAGPPFLVVPPAAADGSLDGEAYDALLEALAPFFGPRPLSAAAALRAMDEEGLTPASLQRPEALVGLAEVLGAAHAVALAPVGDSLRLQVFTPPEDSPSASVEVAGGWPLTRASAQRLAAALAEVASTALAPPAQPPAPPAVPVAQVPETPIEDGDLEAEEASAARQRHRQRAWPAPRALLAVGAGLGERALLSAQEQGALASTEASRAPLLVASLAIYPLRWAGVPGRARWSDALVEARWRRSLGEARTMAEAPGCAVAHDELLVRAGWRWRPRVRWLPRLGAGAGWASERTGGTCAAPFVAARYRTLDVHLRALQSLGSERLSLEVLAGPRFLLSATPAQAAASGLAAEAALSARLTPRLFSRLSARLARFRVGEGSGESAFDPRSALWLEVGLAL